MGATPTAPLEIPALPSILRTSFRLPRCFIVVSSLLLSPIPPFSALNYLRADQLSDTMLSRPKSLSCASTRRLLSKPIPPRSTTPAPFLCSHLSRQHIPPRASPFATMAARRAHDDYALHQPTASVSGGRKYDPEISDMASYVHNYKIDSDLAVIPPPPPSLGSNR